MTIVSANDTPPLIVPYSGRPSVSTFRQIVSSRRGVAADVSPLTLVKSSTSPSTIVNNNVAAWGLGSLLECYVVGILNNNRKRFAISESQKLTLSHCAVLLQCIMQQFSRPNEQ